MIQKVCNLWLEPADYRCIPTSGAVDADGAAILDAPLALDAKERYCDLDIDLGRLLSARGNHVHELRPGVLSFPVKQFQWSRTSEEIVVRSAHEAQEIVGSSITLLPRPPGFEDDEQWQSLAMRLDFLPDNIIVVKHV